MGVLDRIAGALCCHASSMPSLAVSASLQKFKLTHYPSAGLLYFYFRFLALAPSLAALRASKKE